MTRRAAQLNVNYNQIHVDYVRKITFAKMFFKFLGPTGFDSRCYCCICMSGGECTSVINSFALYLATKVMPWLPSFNF